MYSITLFYVDHIAQMFVKVYGDRFRAQQQMLRWLRQKLEPWPTLCSDMKRPFFRSYNLTFAVQVFHDCR